MQKLEMVKGCVPFLKKVIVDNQLRKEEQVTDEQRLQVMKDGLLKMQ